jgi:hypothetical protein
MIASYLQEMIAIIIIVTGNLRLVKVRLGYVRLGKGPFK